jgi:EEF1A N-terminal glycine/lysine methyltransferase
LAAGARKVVVTDYPDEELVQNLRYNIEHGTAAAAVDNIVPEGYLWGASALKLTAHLNGDGDGGAGGFDLLILADLLFNHSEHRKLVSSIQTTLKRAPEPRALVFFTPHRPWLFDRDMAFFDLAREAGFVVDMVLERRLEHAMRVEGGPAVRRSVNDHDYDHDSGGDGGGGDGQDVKKVVFGYQLRWGDESL